MSETRWDINPGTPDTACECPSMDNGRGRRTDERWVIAEGCPLHWPTSPSGVSRGEGTHG